VLLIKIAGAVVLVVLVIAYVARGRRSVRGASPRADSEIPSLPPSPYQPSRGFRLLEGNEPETPRPVALPRLDPSADFIFSDPVNPVSDSISPAHLRHDERWALERSMRRAPHPRVRRRRRWAWFILVVVLGAGIIAAIFADLHTGARHVGLGATFFATPSW
jgi:hypothetical protein